MTILLFDGKEDAYWWVLCLEKFFMEHETPKSLKVLKAVGALRGSAFTWWIWWCRVHRRYNWDTFTTALLWRFKPEWRPILPLDDEEEEPRYESTESLYSTNYSVEEKEKESASSLLKEPDLKSMKPIEIIFPEQEVVVEEHKGANEVIFFPYPTLKSSDACRFKQKNETHKNYTDLGLVSSTSNLPPLILIHDQPLVTPPPLPAETELPPSKPPLKPPDPSFLKMKSKSNIKITITRTKIYNISEEAQGEKLPPETPDRRDYVLENESWLSNWFYSHMLYRVKINLALCDGSDRLATMLNNSRRFAFKKLNSNLKLSVAGFFNTGFSIVALHLFVKMPSSILQSHELRNYTWKLFPPSPTTLGLIIMHTEKLGIPPKPPDSKVTTNELWQPMEIRRHPLVFAVNLRSSNFHHTLISPPKPSILLSIHSPENIFGMSTTKKYNSSPPLHLDITGNTSSSSQQTNLQDGTLGTKMLTPTIGYECICVIGSKLFVLAAKHGTVIHAGKLFEKLPYRDVVIWSEVFKNAACFCSINLASYFPYSLLVARLVFTFQNHQACPNVELMSTITFSHAKGSLQVFIDLQYTQTKHQATHLSTKENNIGNAVAALMADFASKTKILRNGKWCENEAPILVLGDITSIKLGDIIPFNARLLKGDPLKVNQATLTGKSLLVTRHPAQKVFSYSTCKQGENEVIFIATSVHTFFGRATHLVDNINNVGQFHMAIKSTENFCICSITVVIWMGRIPIIMTTILFVSRAIGSHKFSEQGATTKSITAIEEMAGVAILDSGKTETFTFTTLLIDYFFFKE